MSLEGTTVATSKPKPHSSKSRHWGLIYDTHSKAGTVIPITYDIPNDFCLKIDTRERSPLFLIKPIKGLTIVRDTLSYGDYSIKGFESSIAVERKSLPDLYSSIGQGRDRFKRELDILKEYEWKAIVIEGSESEIFRFQDFSQMHPNSVRQTLVSIEVRLGIPIWFGTRDNLERWILDRLIKFYRIKREGG